MKNKKPTFLIVFLFLCFVKMKMETQAKQDFSTAKNMLDEEEEKLVVLQQRKAAYEDEANELLRGILNIRDIEDNKNAILRMEEYIVLQRQQIHLAQRRLDAARERLTEVMKERKTHETLREKAFEEFLQEENRQESKSVDELTSYTYGQKRQVTN